ncbi:MAG: GtrA family protein [Marinibacterium sp.]
MIAAATRSETARRFARFVAVGLLNTAFGYGVYFVLLWAGLAPQAALVIAFVIGVMWNYMTTARLVFRVAGLRRLPAYVGAYLAVYTCNALALQFALSQGANAYVAQAVLTPVFAIMSFGLLSRVFRGVSRPV